MNIFIVFSILIVVLLPFLFLIFLYKKRLRQQSGYMINELYQSAIKEIQVKNQKIKDTHQTQTIPKIIHYIWISNKDNYINVELPDKYTKFVSTWYKNNKDFEFKYWSGKDILNLITLNFPEHLVFYKSLSTISKCDFARFVIIYLFGGVYMDTDFFCKKNLGPLLLNNESYFILEPFECIIESSLNMIFLCVGIFACIPKHKFLLGYINFMIKQKDKTDVLGLAGPVALWNYYKISPYNIYIGDTCLLLPNVYDRKQSSQCNNSFNKYCTTFGSDGSGWTSNYINDSKEYISYIKNPLNNTDIGIINNSFIDLNLVNNFNLNEKEIHSLNPTESLLLAHAFEYNTIYFSSNDVVICEELEKILFINGINNLHIIYNSK